MPPELLIEIVRKHGLGPNQLQVEDSEITCSIGVCVAPEGGACCQDAYRNADVALLDAPSDAIVVCACGQG